LNPFLRGEIEKLNLNQTSLSFKDQEGTTLTHLPWKEEDLEDLVVRDKEGRE
jgi:hypothetical protein